MPDWKPLELDFIPEAAGIYGFRYGKDWLYIGKAQNLRKRLGNAHPALRVAESLTIEITYWYWLVDAVDRLERHLIRDLQPQWNGGTAFDDLPERYLYAGYGPFCLVDDANLEAFRLGLADLARWHPDRLVYFSQAEQQRILHALPLFDGYIAVSEGEKRGAIECL